MNQAHSLLRRGFSLYELLVTISIASTVLAIGVPSFSSVTARNRLHVEINALFHAIHVARKESIMRRQVVSICPSSDATRDESCALLLVSSQATISPVCSSTHRCSFR